MFWGRIDGDIEDVNIFGWRDKQIILEWIFVFLKQEIYREHVRIKIIIIIVLKFNSRIDLGHESCWHGLTRVSVRIKEITNIVLKLDLRVDSGQGLGHEWGWLLTRVNVRTKWLIL